MLPAIALGGVVGAATRTLVVEVLPAGTIAWGVLVANVVGSAVLGWAATRLLRTSPSGTVRRSLLALTSGFCGSLTTFSGLVVDVAESLRSGSTPTGVVYLMISVALGALAVWAGHRAAAAGFDTAEPVTS